MCNEDGHWQNTCPNNADSACYVDYEKLYVDCLSSEDEDNVKCSKNGLDLVDCCGAHSNETIYKISEVNRKLIMKISTPCAIYIILL